MRSIVAGLALLLATAAAARAQSSHLLIVSGLGGEPKYVEAFLEWSTAMAEAAATRYGVAPDDIVVLAEEPSRDARVIDAESRKEEIERAVRAIAARAGDDDRVMILILGHGSSDARGSRVNLPGPDITAQEMASLLGTLGTRPVVVVNAASASGDWQEALAAPTRTIVTATRSGGERNETVFGRYFVDAYRSDGADANRDGRVTLDEAFAYANRETERFYQNAGTLQMEHARMEGNLELAQTFHLGAPSQAAPADASAELRALYERRREIEATVDALRDRRGVMEAAAYQAELERALLELARTNRAIQEMEGASR